MGLLIGGLSALFVQGEASACVNGVYSRVDEGIAWARITEGKLNRGDDEQVVAAVLARYPRIRTVEASSDLLGNLALRWMALAIVRLGGEVPRAKSFPSETTGARAENLEWAASRLRDLYARHRKDATLRCDLGEALASTPEGRSEALDLLQNVEERDLMVSAHSYTALAKLRESRHALRPSFLAAPGAELDRLRIELEEARSVRMHGKSVHRPLDSKEIARARASSPPVSRHLRRLF